MQNPPIEFDALGGASFTSERLKAASDVDDCNNFVISVTKVPLVQHRNNLS